MNTSFQSCVDKILSEDTSKKSLENMSINDKLDLVFCLCVKFYNEVEWKFVLQNKNMREVCSEFIKSINMSEDDYDELHSILDGVYEMQADQQKTGRCSVQSMNNFDTLKFEDNIDKSIIKFRNYLKDNIK